MQYAIASVLSISQSIFPMVYSGHTCHQVLSHANVKDDMGCPADMPVPFAHEGLNQDLMQWHFIRNYG